MRAQVTAYMLELYQDDLCDLLRAAPDKRAADVRPPNHPAPHPS